jgi:hypothetical protein
VDCGTGRSETRAVVRFGLLAEQVDLTFFFDSAYFWVTNSGTWLLFAFKFLFPLGQAALTESA